MKHKGAVFVEQEHGVKVEIPSDSVAANGDCNSTSIALSISSTNYIEEGRHLRTDTVLFWKEKLNSSAIRDDVLADFGVPSFGVLLDQLAISGNWEFDGYDLATYLYAGAIGYSVLLVDLDIDQILPVFPDGLIREMGLGLGFDPEKTSVIVKLNGHYEALCNGVGVRGILISLREEFEEQAYRFQGVNSPQVLDQPPLDQPEGGLQDEVLVEVEEEEAGEDRAGLEPCSDPPGQCPGHKDLGKISVGPIGGDVSHAKLKAVEKDAGSQAGALMKKELKLRYERLILEKPDFSRKISEEGWRTRSVFDLLGDVSRLEHQIGVAKIVADFEREYPDTLGGFNGLLAARAKGGRSHSLKNPPPPLSVVLRHNSKPDGVYREVLVTPVKSTKLNAKALKKAKASLIKKGVLKL